MVASSLNLPPRLTLLRFRSDASFQEADKIGEVLRAYVRHGPELEAAARPAHQVVALARREGLRGARSSRAGPHEHVDEMLSPLVDEGGDFALVEIIGSVRRLAAGNGTYDEEGLRAGSDLFGQRSVRRFVRPIFRAGEES